MLEANGLAGARMGAKVGPGGEGRLEKSAHILLVEDMDAIRDQVSRSLQSSGYSVTPASGADETLGLVAAGLAFDLLLTDVEMPGWMDGIALARYLTTQRTNLPVIVTSGGISSEIVPSRFYFIAKPFRMSELMALVAAALAAHEPRIH